MKAKTIFAILIVLSMLITSVGFAADDGPLFTRNISQTPEQMTGASQMSSMWLLRAGPGHPGRAAGHGLRRAGVLCR